MEESTYIRVQAAYCQWNICDGISYMGENTHTHTHIHTHTRKQQSENSEAEIKDGYKGIEFEGLQEC
jgi:hypothetical protein